MRLDAYKNSGYTVIELLVVFSIIAVMAIVSIASFNSFNDSKINDSAVSDVAMLLNTAKSRAISQVKPSDCLNKTLIGYKVVITKPDQYSMFVLCDNITYPVGTTQFLPKNVIFTNNPSAVFNVSTGILDQPVSINMTGNGINKQININSTGIVSVQ